MKEKNQPYHRVSISKYAKTGLTSSKPNFYRYAFLDSDDVPILTDMHHQEFYRQKRVKCRNTGEIYASVRECASSKNITEKMIRFVCENTRGQSAGPNKLSFCFLDNEDKEILYESHIKYDEKVELASKTQFGMYHTSKLNGYNNPELIINTETNPLDECVTQISAYLT